MLLNEKLKTQTHSSFDNWRFIDWQIQICRLVCTDSLYILSISL